MAAVWALTVFSEVPKRWAMSLLDLSKEISRGITGQITYLCASCSVRLAETPEGYATKSRCAALGFSEIRLL